MSDAALKRMDADEFLLWREGREGTWELVDGVPFLKFDNGPEMMAGARRAHVFICSNLVRELGVRLRGKPCVALPADLAVRTRHDKVRQPDVLIECGDGADDDLEARQPTVIVEVLSQSTRGYDLLRKAEEYRGLDTLKHLVFVEQKSPKVLVWSRTADGWEQEAVEGLGETLHLPAVGVSLPMAQVYEGVRLAS